MDIRTQAVIASEAIRYLFKIEKSGTIWILGFCVSVPLLRALILPSIILFAFVARLIEGMPSQGKPSTNVLTLLEDEPNQGEVHEIQPPKISISDIAAFLAIGLRVWIIILLYSSFELLVIYLTNLDPRTTTLLQEGIELTPLANIILFHNNLSEFGAALVNLPIFSPFDDYILFIQDNILLILIGYIAPVSIAHFAITQSNSLFSAFNVNAIRPILSSRTYLIGWVFSAPFLTLYWIVSDAMIITSTTVGTTTTGYFWIIGHLMFGPLVSFYCLVTGFYIIGQTVYITQTTQLTSFAQRVQRLFASNPSETGQIDTTNAHIRPSIDWFEEVLATEESFRENRYELTAWIRRILPETVMYQMRTPHGWVGAELPTSTVPLGTIHFETLQGEATIVVWYA